MMETKKWQINSAEPAMDFQTIFKKYEPLVQKMKKKYFLRDIDEQDWLQESQIVCYKSLESYNRHQGISFGAYFRRSLDHHFCSLLRTQQALKRKAWFESTYIEEAREKLGDAWESEREGWYGKTSQLELQEKLSSSIHQLSLLETQLLEDYLAGMSIQESAARRLLSTLKAKRGFDRMKRKLKGNLKN